MLLHSSWIGNRCSCWRVATCWGKDATSEVLCKEHPGDDASCLEEGTLQGFVDSSWRWWPCWSFPCCWSWESSIAWTQTSLAGRRFFEARDCWWWFVWCWVSGLCTYYPSVSKEWGSGFIWWWGCWCWEEGVAISKFWCEAFFWG